MPSRLNSTASAERQTAHAAKARQDLYGRAGPRSSKAVIGKNEPQDCVHHWEKEAHIRDGMQHYKTFKAIDAQPPSEDDDEIMTTDSASDTSTNEQESQIKKRGAGANMRQSGPNKKAKTKDTSQAAAGDKTRVPKKGQTTSWQTIQGTTEGEVVEVVYEDKTVAGKAARGSMEDPRVVVRSEKTGTVVVHKPEAVEFD